MMNTPEGGAEAPSTATYEDGRVVHYQYNGDGQLHSVKETGGDSPATYLRRGRSLS